jgi:hypothetical protein
MDARIAAMELAREQDMAKMEEKYARRRAELQAKKADLDARKRGDTTMGSKDERVAFMRVLEAKGGFGFNYAQALAVLKQVSEGSNMDNTERLAALGDEGRALMQPRMPKRSPQANAATGSEGGADANEECPTAPTAQESDAPVTAGLANDAAGGPEEDRPATLATAWASREELPCVLLVDGHTSENHGEGAPAGDGNEGNEWDDDPLPRSSGDTATGYERSSVEQEEWA